MKKSHNLMQNKFFKPFFLLISLIIGAVFFHNEITFSRICLLVLAIQTAYAVDSDDESPESPTKKLRRTYPEDPSFHATDAPVEQNSPVERLTSANEYQPTVIPGSSWLNTTSGSSKLESLFTHSPSSPPKASAANAALEPQQNKFREPAESSHADHQAPKVQSESQPLAPTEPQYPVLSSNDPAVSAEQVPSETPVITVEDLKNTYKPAIAEVGKACELGVTIVGAGALGKATYKALSPVTGQKPALVAAVAVTAGSGLASPVVQEVVAHGAAHLAHPIVHPTAIEEDPTRPLPPKEDPFMLPSALDKPPVSLQDYIPGQLPILFSLCGFFALCLLIYLLFLTNKKDTPKISPFYWLKTYCAAFLVVVFFILYVCGSFADPTITVFGTGFRASVLLFFIIWGFDYVNANHEKEKQSKLVRVLMGVYDNYWHNTIAIGLLCFFLILFLLYGVLFFGAEFLKS